MENDTRKSIQVFWAMVSAILGLVLLLKFNGSRWGEWPWYFSPREAGFDRIELVVFFLAPLTLASLLALCSGKARPYLLAFMLLVLVLSLV